MSEGDDPRDSDERTRDDPGDDEPTGTPTDDSTGVGDRTDGEGDSDGVSHKGNGPATGGDASEGGSNTDDSDQDAAGRDGDGGGGSDGTARDGEDGAGFRADAATQEDIDDLRREIDALEEHVEERTVHRDSVEGELKQYIRWRLRRGHARDWGPYLVLLYGTLMTLGAFVFLNGVWAILAMLVVWLSTLGLYALMLIVGISLTVLAVPRRLVEKLRDIR